MLPFAGAGLWDVQSALTPDVGVVVEPGAARPKVAEGGPLFLPPIAHGVALLTAIRVTEAYLYPTPFAESPAGWGAYYKETFTRRPLFDVHKRAFEWDGDPWTINVIGHGLLGSELYLRARHCRFGVAGSLLFAAAGSTTWEYLFEGNGVRPSAQDLVYTPLAGLVLGEGRYFAWQAAGGVANPTARGVFRAILDPFGELERAVGSPC